MVGLVGGRSLESLESMEDIMDHEKWYEHERASVGSNKLALLHHGKRDPNGYTWLWNQEAIGTLHGVITNENQIGVTFPDLVNQLLEEPGEVLPRLEGSFVLACANEEKLVLAVDKLGTKPCFYVSEENVAFASEVKALLGEVETPTTNLEAIGDLLAFNFIWGEKSLVEEIVAVPPGSYIEWTEDGETVERYFDFTFEEHSNDYVGELVATYRESIQRVASTIPEGKDIGVWLSGGLDSRLLTGVLDDEFDDIHTYTFDANPGGGANIGPARQTAELLDISNHVLDFTPSEFAEVMEQGVILSDGRLPWNHYFGLPFILKEMPSRTDILMEVTGQGELFGEDIPLWGIQSDTSPTEILFDNFARRPESEVNAFLTRSVSPTDSVRTTVEASRRTSSREIALDTLYRVFYPYYHCRTRFYEAKIPLRMPLSYEPLLNMAINQPDKYRRRKAQSPLNKAPPFAEMPVSELKLALIRELGKGLEGIPYERTKMAPKWHLLAHSLRHWFKVSRLKLTGSMWTMDRWYQENNNFRKRVDKWLDAAKKRDIFDSETIEQKRQRHLNGKEKNMQSLSVITTVEIWLQNYVDNQ